jgi:acyl carrier protein
MHFTRLPFQPHTSVEIDNQSEGSHMSTAVSQEQIEQVVTESLESFGADPEQITPEATLEALDIDSLDLAELSQIVQERFDVELKSADVADVKTVGDAIRLIAERA